MSLLNPYDDFNPDEDQMTLEALISELFKFLLGSILGMISSTLTLIGFLGFALGIFGWLLRDDHFLRLSSIVSITTFSIGTLGIAFFFLMQIYYRKKQSPKWISNGFIVSFVALLLSLLAGLVSMVYISTHASQLLH